MRGCWIQLFNGKTLDPETPAFFHQWGTVGKLDASGYVITGVTQAIVETPDGKVHAVPLESLRFAGPPPPEGSIFGGVSKEDLDRTFPKSKTSPWPEPEEGART